MNKVNDFLDGLIAFWHLNEKIDVPLHYFLGFTDEEYASWIRGEAVPLNIKEKIESIKGINMDNNKLKTEIQNYIYNNASNVSVLLTSDGLTEYITSCINTLIENKTLIYNTESWSVDDKLYAREMRRELIIKMFDEKLPPLNLIKKVDFWVNYVMEGK